MAAAETIGVAPAGSGAELDELTLAGAKRGDPRACQRFVAVYERRVFAMLSRVLGPSRAPTLVEDLAQETFLRALRALPRFDVTGAAKLSTWLLTVATRVALSEMRRHRPDHAPLELAPEPQHTADTRQVEARHALRLVIGSLTPEQRAVFVLRDVHGFTESEVAHALELDVEAVKSRLFRARRRLRTMLEGTP